MLNSKFYCLFFLLFTSVSFMQDDCISGSKVMIDGGKYKNEITYLAVSKIKGSSKLNEDELNELLDNSLHDNCLTFFKSKNKDSNLAPRFLYKYIKKKLGSSKVSSTKKKLKNIDVIFFVDITPTTFKIELYNTRIELLGKYHNKKLSGNLNENLINEMFDEFYSRYFFTAVNVHKDRNMYNCDSVIINGKKFGEVDDYDISDQNMFVVDYIPKNIKSYIQIESDNEDRISDKYFISPIELSIKRKNKKRIDIKPVEDVSLSYRNKIGAFKINLVGGDGANLNYLNPEVKLRDMLNPKGIGTKLINNNNHIIVLTEEKFQKQWNYKAVINAEGYPSTFPKTISLVDSSSYKLYSSNAVKEFVLTEKSQSKTYLYNILLPGLGCIYAGDKEKLNDLKSRDRDERSFFENHQLISYTTIPTYILSSISFITNAQDYLDYKDQYEENLSLYNNTGLGEFKDLTNKYYSKATKAEENMYKFAFISLAVNVFSNYYLGSKWFTWK